MPNLYSPQVLNHSIFTRVFSVLFLYETRHNTDVILSQRKLLHGKSSCLELRCSELTARQTNGQGINCKIRSSPSRLHSYFRNERMLSFCYCVDLGRT